MSWSRMMPRHDAGADLLDRLERYYDKVPRPTAVTEEVGPFTLFVATEGWQFYARPRLGQAAFTADDVRQMLEVQRERDLPQHIEWVHEATPRLLAAAREAGVPVAECPLLVLGEPVRHSGEPAVTAEMVEPDDLRFALARAAVAAGFEGRDELRPEPVLEHITARVRDGLMRVAGAFDADGAAIGGGSHAQRGDVSELTGIAVLPRYRQRGVGAALTKVLADDTTASGATTVFLSAGTPAVARVYERVGFRRVGTACIVELP